MAKKPTPQKPKPPAAARNVVGLAELLPDDRNANKGNKRGRDLIENSIRTLKAGRSVLVDKNMRIIAGNKTVEGAIAADLKDAIVVQSDGSKLIVHQRTDLDLDKDPEARALAVADNRAAEISLTWDGGVLASLGADFNLDLEGLGFSDKELSRMAPAADAEPPAAVDVDASYQVVIECPDEAAQKTVFERMKGEGFKCKALTL